jgi:hypothetical protein
MATPTDGRDGTSGKFLPGNSAGNGVNGGGRPKLPDWFKDRAPQALRYLLLVAVGEEPAEAKDRIKAAQTVVDRVYGKAPETLTLEGGSPVLDLLVNMAKPVIAKE